MIRNAFSLSVAALVALTGVTASASLIGDEVTLVTSVNGNQSLSLAFEVEEGVVELPFFPNFAGPNDFQELFATDIEAESISLIAGIPIPGIVNGFEAAFTDLDWLDSNGMNLNGSIVGISVDSSFLAADRVSFTADSVTFDLGGITTMVGDYIDVTLIVEHPPIGNVPEPATMTLLGLGLAGMAYRKRNRSA